MDPRLQHPFTCIVAGPTGCGKTEFVKRLIANRVAVFDQPPEYILWCYGEYQPLYASIEADFVEGLPDLDSIDAQKRNLIVLDDLLMETDDRVAKLFTKVSHHRNTSIVYITQNLFQQNKVNRTISLNAHYMVLFKNPRDVSQVTHLAKQMYPGHVKFMQEAFKDATEKPYGYLLVDLKPHTPESLRLRTDIFPGEVQYVYLRKV